MKVLNIVIVLDDPNLIIEGILFNISCQKW